MEEVMHEGEVEAGRNLLHKVNNMETGHFVRVFRCLSALRAVVECQRESTKQKRHGTCCYLSKY